MRSARKTVSPLRAGPIRGDELEHNRIQLEHNLQHNTDLSLHLSSQPADSDREHNYESSVEYPRHNSGPEPFAVNAFASFDGDNFAGDMDSHSHLHAWSYRTADDDDEGVNPYGGESLSTAAHHASALTLSAGLRGHGAARRDISFSGVEYDPERPLGDMIAGVDSHFTMFDDQSKSKSRYQAASSVAFDPLVVDDTAELDRVLQSGHATIASSLAARLRPTVESASSGSDTDTSSRSNRSKLSDALQRVSTFSPKRPRSVQSVRAYSSQNQIPTRGAGPSNYTYPRSASSPPEANFEPSHADVSDIPTPKSRSKKTAVQQPAVMVQPPTPSTVGSKFTKMARGLARDIEAEQRSMWGAAIKDTDEEADILAQSTVHERKGKSRGPRAVERNPFSDIGNALGTSARQRKGTPSAPKVHLPDVTGLTSAVASPAKNGLDYHGYEGGDEPRDAEARFLSVLAAVQSKLAHIESENGISRRRVRELEHELETCKAEVARERTRVLERESVIVQQREESQRARRQEKGKGKSTRFESDEELEVRYREVVEEKKALEALITTLRTHLARLTSELSSHQQLLSELRSLRESDAKTLREKSAEVERLREEVERLAGEVEVLKGVVEEGLNERRAIREASIHVEEQENEEREQAEEVQHDREDLGDETPLISPRVNMDRTMRTDHATLGSSNTVGVSTGRFIDGEELDRISLELEERKSDRSAGSVSQMRREVSGDSGHSQRDDRIPSPSAVTREQPSVSSKTHHCNQSASRPAAPTPAHAFRQPPSRRSKPGTTNEDALSTPFPQIRGGRLEKLFFSAPEHNAKTCSVCHRRSRRPDSPSWYPKRKQGDMRTRVEGVDDDEGIAEGPASRTNHRAHVDFSPDTAQGRMDDAGDGLPPQTVLARVLRELEDDFTHYKSIYVELAEQYGLMDATSNVQKRNVLAEHLREVIDILEQKGDHIASLYDLLTFKDKPISESVLPDNHRTRWHSIAGRTRNLKRHPTLA